MKWSFVTKKRLNILFFVKLIFSASHDGSRDIVPYYLHHPAMPSSAVDYENSIPASQQNPSSVGFVLPYAPGEKNYVETNQLPGHFNAGVQILENHDSMPNPDMMHRSHNPRFFWVPVQCYSSQATYPTVPVNSGMAVGSVSRMLQAPIQGYPNQTTYPTVPVNSGMAVGNASRMPQAPIQGYPNQTTYQTVPVNNGMAVGNASRMPQAPIQGYPNQITYQTVPIERKSIIKDCEVLQQGDSQNENLNVLDDSNETRILYLQQILNEYNNNFANGIYFKSFIMAGGRKHITLERIFTEIQRTGLMNYVKYIQDGVKAEHVLNEISKCITEGCEVEELVPHYANFFSIILLNREHTFSTNLEDSWISTFVKKIIRAQFFVYKCGKQVPVRFHSIKYGIFVKNIPIEDYFQLCLSRFLFISGKYIGGPSHRQHLLDFLDEHGI